MSFVEKDSEKGSAQMALDVWSKEYSGRDLNPHALRHQNLNLACLPISPPEHLEGVLSIGAALLSMRERTASCF